MECASGAASGAFVCDRGARRYGDARWILRCDRNDLSLRSQGNIQQSVLLFRFDARPDPGSLLDRNRDRTCHRRGARLRRKEGGGACVGEPHGRTAEEGGRMSVPALQLRDVRKSFGRTSIINGVNLSISPGERHAIIGPNGAGKSTLFNLISGRFGVTSGRIDLHGESINGLEPEIINRKGLARSFQITNIFPRMSVYENVRCAVLWSQGYKYSFWHRVDALATVRERTSEIVDRI